MNAFKDHFSGHASDYAKYRPTYPASLFKALAEICPEHDLAWDCGTGNGQTAYSLAAHFQKVVASDASEEQIANAKPHAGVEFCVAPAEKSPLKDHSADLVTASAALHWFHHDEFYPELKRVLKPQGIFAAWTYQYAQVSPEIDELINAFYKEVRKEWPGERIYIEEKYQTIPFPLEDIAFPNIQIETEWDLDHLLGYLNTWSGTRKYVTKFGDEILHKLRQDILKYWPEPEVARKQVWPLYIRVGRFA